MAHRRASISLLAVAFVVQRAAKQEPLQRKASTASDLAAYFFLTIGTASVLVHTLKIIVGRARPELFTELGAYSLTPFANTNLYESFPSGHSTAAGAFFGVFAMLLPKLGRSATEACCRSAASSGVSSAGVT